MPDQHQNIRELIEHNDELENYFRNTIIPQLFVDGDLRLQKFTPPAMKQFSLSVADLGKHISDIKENFRFPTILDNIQIVIDSNEILEKEIQTTDMRWYQMNIIPYIRMKDNKTDGVIITFVEITMRIKDLKEQEKLVADHEILLDTIAHDIKNPLTSLVLAIDLFKQISPDDQQKFHILLKVVENSLSKMNKIVHELTEIRKEDHKYKSVDELLNFEHILEDVRLTLNESIIQSGAKIKTEILVSELIFSRRKLRSIVYNLLSNALKFRAASRNPEIVVKTYREDDHLVISVKDNGIGIDNTKMDDIFSKYYRLENQIEGSGIGLYLVKEIVISAGGKITLQSREDEGTEFCIYLKVA